MGLPRHSRQYFTYADYARWGGERGWELIDGQTYAMAPSPSVAQVGTVVQPDLLVVRGPAKVDAKDIRGAPDWGIKVLSPRTASYDQADVLETSGETICLTLPQVRVDPARVIDPATPVD